MSVMKANSIRVACCSLSLLLVPAMALAQEPSGGASPSTSPAAQQGQAPPPAPGWHRFSERRSDPPASAQQSSAVPSQLTLRPGTQVTVRVDQMLSSDRNQAGETFFATLERPLVVDGVVVAQRGESVSGRVAEAQKAGRVSGVSRLALQLTELTLVDGQPVPVQTQLTAFKGPTSNGRDAAAVVGTTALGAAIGAAADWGRGAAIGAGAGAAAGTLGVLLTRGRPTVIYPETQLTFRLEAPATFSTARAPLAFRLVEPEDYGRAAAAPVAPAPPPPPPCPAYGCAPPPYYYYGPAYYPYYYGPYFYGPSFTFWYGPRFFRGREFREHEFFEGRFGDRGFGGRGFRFRR